VAQGEQAGGPVGRVQLRVIDGASRPPHRRSGGRVLQGRDRRRTRLRGNDIRVGREAPHQRRRHPHGGVRPRRRPGGPRPQRVCMP